MSLYAKLMDAIAKEDLGKVESTCGEIWGFPKCHRYLFDFLQVCGGSFDSFVNLRDHLLPDWIYRAEEQTDGTTHVLMLTRHLPAWHYRSRVETVDVFGGHEKCAAKAGAIAILKALEHFNKEAQ